jgi:OOP family OmpA-OmpF porin
MLRKLTGLVSCGLIIGAASMAQAQTEDAWYVGGGLLANKLTDSNLSGAGLKFKNEYDWGWGLLGQVGRSFGPLRGELELGWRNNDVEKVNGAKSNGDMDSWTLMTNLYYDIRTGTSWTPYLGVGVGGAMLDADGTLGGARLNDTDTVFAYQGIAGVAYALNDALSIKADYRYLDTMDGKFKAGTTKYEGDYSAHSILVGFNYRFGVEKKPAAMPAPAPVAQPARPTPPPPPPPAVRAPDPVRNYLVFFDFDKSVVTPEAQSIIQQAAAAAKQGRSVRIELTGHADRAGSDKYNMALSQRRADAVRDQLVKQGLPVNAIGVAAKGESTPLIPTADGVREPQNRRVEIILQ